MGEDGDEPRPIVDHGDEGNQQAARQGEGAVLELRHTWDKSCRAGEKGPKCPNLAHTKMLSMVQVHYGYVVSS